MLRRGNVCNPNHIVPIRLQLLKQIPRRLKTPVFSNSVYFNPAGVNIFVLQLIMCAISNCSSEHCHGYPDLSELFKGVLSANSLLLASVQAPAKAKKWTPNVTAMKEEEISLANNVLP